MQSRQTRPNNQFADHIVGLLSGSVLLLNSIIDIKWVSVEEGYLLIRAVPPSEDCYDEVKDAITELFQEDSATSRFKYQVAGQVILDGSRRRNLLMKVTQIAQSRNQQPNKHHVRHQPATA